MKSRAESSRAGGQQKMEGVNMPASFKFAWRRLVGATAAAIFVLAALPGVGHAENIEICIGAKGKVKGINLGTGGATVVRKKSIGSPPDRPGISAWREWSETQEFPVSRDMVAIPALRVLQEHRERLDLKDQRVLRARRDQRVQLDSWVRPE